jgi:hypothetical protein
MSVRSHENLPIDGLLAFFQGETVTGNKMPHLPEDGPLV